MRIALLTLALILASALGWLALATEPLDPIHSTVSAQENPTIQVPLTSDDLAVPKAVAIEAGDRELGEEIASTQASLPKVRFGELEVLGRLVCKDGAPLANYTVLVAPSGLKPHRAGAIEPSRRCITDSDGHCTFSELTVPGPWDVYAFPMDLGVERSSIERRARVGTVTAGNPGETERVTFELATGPVIVLRSPLPASVHAEDLWFEALPRIGLDELVRSADSRVKTQAPRARTVHRFSQGVAADEGYVTALLPSNVEPTKLHGYGVHVRTRNGLFGLISTGEEYFAIQEKIAIDESLEKRGRLRIRLSIRDVRQGTEASPMDDGDWGRAIEVVDWKLLLDDPARSGEGVPSSFRTTSRNQLWAPLGAGVFEITDLPLGVPIEVGALGAAEKVPSDEVFVPETLVQTTPVHGDPEPVEVRIRRVR